MRIGGSSLCSRRGWEMFLIRTFVCPAAAASFASSARMRLTPLCGCRLLGTTLRVCDNEVDTFMWLSTVRYNSASNGGSVRRVHAQVASSLRGVLVAFRRAASGACVAESLAFFFTTFVVDRQRVEPVEEHVLMFIRLAGSCCSSLLRDVCIAPCVLAQW